MMFRILWKLNYMYVLLASRLKAENLNKKSYLQQRAILTTYEARNENCRLFHYFRRSLIISLLT